MTRSDVQQGPSGVLPGRRRAPRARDARRLLRQPVRQSRQLRRRTRRPRRRRSGSRWSTGSMRWCAASAPAARSPGCRISSRAPRRRCEMVLADPAGSVLADYAKTGKLGRADDAWLVEGIGGDSVPPVCDFSRVEQAYTIPDAEAFRTCRELLSRRRASSPAPPPARCWPRRCATAASRQRPKRVVTFVCDSGNKYLSKVYNDYWMLDQGFIEREHFGDLRDLIARRHWERAAVTVDSTEPVLAAYRRMKLYDVSQVPVHARTAASSASSTRRTSCWRCSPIPQHFNEPVTKAMASHLVTVPADAPIDAADGDLQARHGGHRHGRRRVPGARSPASICSTGCAAGMTLHETSPA